MTPSFLRSVRDPNLIATWRHALDLLRDSDRWIVIGYQFPDEDVAIRALFTRAYSSGIKVSVVQLDEKALPNYECFFPPNQFEYYTGGLELLLECVRWESLPRRPSSDLMPCRPGRLCPTVGGQRDK